MSATTTNTAELETLCEEIGFLYEAYGELNAEYRGEIVRYGDAWPGSADQVRSAAATLRQVEARIDHLAAILGRGPVHGPDVPVVELDDADLPF